MWAMLRRRGNGDNNRGKLSPVKTVPEQRRKLSRQGKTWSTRSRLIQEGHTEALTWLSGQLTLQTIYAFTWIKCYIMKSHFITSLSDQIDKILLFEKIFWKRMREVASGEKGWWGREVGGQQQIGMIDSGVRGGGHVGRMQTHGEQGPLAGTGGSSARAFL